VVGPPWWRQRVGGAAGRQCGSHVGGCRLPVRQVRAAVAVVAAGGPWCGRHCGGGGSAVWRVGGSAGRRCGRSAVRRVGGAAGRQCGSRVGGCGLRSGKWALPPPWWRRRAGGVTVLVASAFQWCHPRGGGSGSVARQPSSRWRVSGAAAVVATVRRWCGGSAARRFRGAAVPRCGGSAVRWVGGPAVVVAAAGWRCGGSAARPPWCRRRVSGAAAMIAAAC